MWCNQQAVWQCNPLQLPQRKDTIESSICTISGATFPGENMVHCALIDLEHSSAPSSRYTEATTNEETWDGISHCFKYAGTICACHDTWSITWVTTYTSHLVVEHTNTSLSAMGIGNRYATIWLRTSLILWVTRSLIPNPITDHFSTGKKWCMGLLVSRFWTSIQTLPPLTSNAVHTNRVGITCWRIQLMTAAATVVERHITRHWSVQYIYAETAMKQTVLHATAWC